MKLAAISAALALFTLSNGMPTAAEADLEARKKDKSGCDVFKKDLKKLQPAASAYCSSFIATTTTITIPITITEIVTQTSTVPVTTTNTVTITGPAPTVTQTVFSDCGVVGYDNGTLPAYFFDVSGAFGTFDTCQARCKQDAGSCRSFVFGAGSCGLYTSNVVPAVLRASTSPYTFFAANCPAPTTPAPVVAATALKRQAGTPEPLGEYEPAQRSAFCSCAVAVPSTSTLLVSSTSTVGTTTLTTTTATVTAIVTTEVTPAPITVTVTTTA